MIDFQRKVTEDLRNPHSPWSDELRRPENLDEWYEVLRKVDEDIMRQLADAKVADRDTRRAIKNREVTREEGGRVLREREEWRKRAVFKWQFVVDRIQECKKLMRERDPIDVLLKAKFINLQVAIEKHQAVSKERGFEPEDHDLELWAAVNTPVKTLLARYRDRL